MGKSFVISVNFFSNLNARNSNVFKSNEYRNRVCYSCYALFFMNSQQQLSRNAGGDADGCDKTFVSDGPKVIKQINNMRNTIYSLERSFDMTRSFEAEQWSRFRRMKTCNAKLSTDLKEVEQRNTTMLNLFRANVTDDLPESLKNQVRRSWQQKYDALLKMNNQLRRETRLKHITIREKNYEIAVLQQQLLNIGEKLIERNKVVKTIANKYSNMKRKKDEQEVLLRGSMETLQNSTLMKTKNDNITSETLRMSLMPSKEALLAYESRRCDRLTRENCLLRASLQQSRINCKCNHSSDDVSCVSPLP